MASLGSTDNIDVGIALGSTWGTAADFTSAGDLIHCSNLNLNAGFGQFLPRDIGFDNFVGAQTRLEKTVSLSITCDLSYDGAWLMLLFAFLGTSTASPTENNVGEGDYSHTGAMQGETGKFLTLAWDIEDDEVLEVPSAVVQSITIAANANGVGTFQANLIGDQVIDPASVTNSSSDINGLSLPTYEAAVLGNTNHYFRIDDYSTSASLSSADDQEIASYSVTIQRPMQARYVLRGANSKYTLLPKQLGPATGNLQFQLTENDSANFDAISDWLSEGTKMAEIFFDGTQIGAGDNRSVKMSMPSMKQLQAPAGYDVPSNNSLIQPAITYEFVKAAAAGSGMAGFTSYMQAVAVGTRSATWVGA